MFVTWPLQDFHDLVSATVKGGGRLIVVVVKVIVVLSGYARRCVDQSVVRSVDR